MAGFYVKTDTQVRQTPWANWALIALNLLIFALSLTQRFGHWNDRHFLNPRDPHLLNFLTYAFLHKDWPHILSNLLALWIFGNNVNDRLGHVGYLAFYLAAAVVVGIGRVLSSAQPLIGASGAVVAVMGAYLALLPRSRIVVSRTLIVIPPLEVPAILFIVVYFCFNLVMSLSGPSQVAYGAHITGMVFGFAVGMTLLTVRLVDRNPWDFLALSARWNRRRQYRALVKQGYNPFAPPPAEAPPPKPPIRTLRRIEQLSEQMEQAFAARNVPRASALFVELRQLEPDTVLPRQRQLDVANQLMSDHLYADAAQAYEAFLTRYGNFQQIEQVQLMLGILCARYLNRPERAAECLNQALARLHGAREIAMAREELARITPKAPD